MNIFHTTRNFSGHHKKFEETILLSRNAHVIDVFLVGFMSLIQMRFFGEFDTVTIL